MFILNCGLRKRLYSLYVRLVLQGLHESQQHSIMGYQSGFVILSQSCCAVHALLHHRALSFTPLTTVKIVGVPEWSDAPQKFFVPLQNINTILNSHKLIELLMVW